jgi:transposase
MSVNDLEIRIRYLREVQKLSFRQIARQTGIARSTIFRISSGIWKGPRTPRDFLLDPHRDLILRWYQDCPALKAVQVHQRLVERGVAIDSTTVARYTREFRRKQKTRVFWPLTFLPGEEAQVDWFFMDHPKLGRLCGFVMILSFSRYCFAHCFPRHAFEFFIEGHLRALSSFGGCPHALRYDNLKSVVLHRQPLTYNPAFLDFARHAGFEIRLCNPAAGNEKGRVERLIRALRETFCNVAAHHQSLKALNADLHEWVKRKNETVHRATDKKPVDAMKEEKLKPLPDGPWCNVVIHPPKKPTKTGLVIFDTNAYSFPDHLGGQQIIVHASVDRVDLVTLDQKIVASHARSFERQKQITNPIHRTVARLSAPAKRERILAVMRGMDPVMARFFDAHHLVGEEPHAQAAELFALLTTHGKAALLSAVRECVAADTLRLAAVRARLEPVAAAPAADVRPRDTRLLDIDYQPRSLEDYDDGD